MALIEQYEELHRTRSYGISSIGNYHYFLPLIREIAPKTIIDFGCGQSRLPDAIAETLGIPVTRFDPAIPAYASRPNRLFDLLINVDVLEHIPEQELDAVIADIAALGRNALIVIDTVPAETILPNGQNAHVTVHPSEWWQTKLTKAFPFIEPIRVRSRRRAAFKTWQTPAWRTYSNALMMPLDYIRYRAFKLRFERENENR